MGVYIGDYCAKFQSTLLQEERLLCLTTFAGTQTISIHAPTRGATSSTFIGMWQSYISIHAPTRGATARVSDSILRHVFQSTLLQEERPSLSQSFPATLPISIHAPTRGATPHIRQVFRKGHNFNPRSYKRSDAPRLPSRRIPHISIHAPTRGATTLFLVYHNINKDFNPRSYKRSDYIRSLSRGLLYHFNPRSYKRSDSKNAQYSLCISAIIIA